MEGSRLLQQPEILHLFLISYKGQDVKLDLNQERHALTQMQEQVKDD